MIEENGRFFRRKSHHPIKLKDEIVKRIDIADKIHQSEIRQQEYRRFSSTLDFDDVNLKRFLQQKIGQYLKDGRRMEAIALETVARRLSRRSYLNDTITKANFNPAEPRDRGKWSSYGRSSAPSRFEDVQYRGYFHDFMLNELLESLTSHGAVAIKNVPVFGVNGILAIPDGASRPPGFAQPFPIEMKTGFDAELTPNQRKVYPLICLGGHAVSFDPRLPQLGLTPGVLLPPLRIMIVHTFGPGFPINVHDYCSDFLE